MKSGNYCPAKLTHICLQFLLKFFESKWLNARQDLSRGILTTTNSIPCSCSNTSISSALVLFKTSSNASSQLWSVTTATASPIMRYGSNLSIPAFAMSFSTSLNSFPQSWPMTAANASLPPQSFLLQPLHPKYETAAWDLLQRLLGPLDNDSQECIVAAAFLLQPLHLMHDNVVHDFLQRILAVFLLQPLHLGHADVLSNLPRGLRAVVNDDDPERVAGIAFLLPPLHLEHKNVLQNLSQRVLGPLNDDDHERVVAAAFLSTPSSSSSMSSGTSPDPPP
ncbi:hypothetical protein C8R46DRAFT_1208106 [Mycena filopes]|nr:hypothetical protein C8R46DRAFT_1208106 [Mycena filopes]